MKNQKEKKYLLYKTTVGELLKLAKETDMDIPPYDKREIASYARTKAFTGRQKLVQMACKEWEKHRETNIVPRSYELEKIIPDIVLSAVLKAGDEPISEKIKKEVCSIPIFAFACFYASRNMYVKTDIGTKEEDYIDDKDKLAKEINNTYENNISNHELYCVERISVYWFRGHVEILEKAIEKAIKKSVKETLTYCLKNGKVIVPKEYLEKGKAGIKEWQEKKRNCNKNNSMEKRLIRSTLRDKKNKIYHAMRAVERKIDLHSTEMVPALSIDGLYNQMMQKKLITLKLLKDKTEQDIICMTDEQILTMTKEYWLNELKRAGERIETLKQDALLQYPTRTPF